MGSFALKTISIAVVIALIVGAGAGYMVGNSPVSSLMEEYDLLETEHDTLYLHLQSVEAESNSAQELLQSVEAELHSTEELLVEEQRDNELLQERYMEMFVIDQENQLLIQQVIELGTFLDAYLEVKKPLALSAQIEAWDNLRPFAFALDPELDLCIDAIISDIEAYLHWYNKGLELEEHPLATDMEQLIFMGEGFSCLGRWMIDLRQFEKVYCNVIRDHIQAEPEPEPTYQGRLDTWYHYKEADTEEVNPLYDAKIIDGSWSLLDLGNGAFSLMMRWTELNLDEEAEGAPPGTYDNFIVTLWTQDINIEDPDFPGMFVLYGDAYWQKIDWEGTIGEWTSSGVEIHISPFLYDHQFLYYHSGYVAGVGLLIYGSLYPS